MTFLLQVPVPVQVGNLKVPIKNQMKSLALERVAFKIYCSLQYYAGWSLNTIPKFVYKYYCNDRSVYF